MNFSKEVKVTRVMNAQAAGTTDLNSASVDMKGFDGVVFIAQFGTITSGAVTSVHAAQSADDTSFADLAGTGISIPDTADNKVAIIDVYRPTDRYVRCEIDRGTQNAVVDGVIAMQYKGRKSPVTHDSATVVAAELHVSPDEGTA